MGKTLQGLADERVEREEVEAQREGMVMAEAQVQGIEEEEVGGMEEEEEGEGERDLDGDVPDAEEDGGWMSEDEEGGMMEEGDLDDEVLEAEGYEHTDTEVEDSSGDEVRGPRVGTFNRRTGEVVGMAGAGAGVLGSSVFGNGGGSAEGSGVVASGGGSGRRVGFGGVASGLGEN